MIFHGMRYDFPCLPKPGAQDMKTKGALFFSGSIHGCEVKPESPSVHPEPEICRGDRSCLTS